VWGLPYRIIMHSLVIEALWLVNGGHGASLPPPSRRRRAVRVPGWVAAVAAGGGGLSPAGAAPGSAARPPAPTGEPSGRLTEAPCPPVTSHGASITPPFGAGLGQAAVSVRARGATGGGGVRHTPPRPTPRSRAGRCCGAPVEIVTEIYLCHACSYHEISRKQPCKL
jgi:hypothetical protein